MITQNWRRGVLCSPHVGRFSVLIISLLACFLLLLLGIRPASAFADLKQDHVSGTIKVTMDPGEPVKPVTPVTPVNPQNPEKPINPVKPGNSDRNPNANNPDNSNIGKDNKSANAEASNWASDTTINNYNLSQYSIKDFLAKTGDTQYLLIFMAVLLVAGSLIAILVARKKNSVAYSSDGKAISLLNLRKFSIVLIALSLLFGSIFALSKAFAEDFKDNNDISNQTTIASLDVEISVTNDGTVKAASLNLKNNLNTALHLSRLTAKSSNELSTLLNSRLESEEIVSPKSSLSKTWSFENKKIDTNMISKLKSEESRKIAFDIDSDVAYNTVKVEFLANDGTDKVVYSQEVIEGNNASMPIDIPVFANRKFNSWSVVSKGEGAIVDADYLSKNAIATNVKFYARWTGPEVFLAKKSDDIEMPCKIYDGEDTTTEFITLDEVKKASDTLRNGGSVDSDVYSATNDEWHLFAKVSNEKNYAINWIECRIIHAGQHDKDGSGLTFQTVHALTYNPYFDSKRGSHWSKSFVKDYLNGYFFFELPKELQNSIHKVVKNTHDIRNRYDRVRHSEGNVQTLERVFVLGISELVYPGTLSRDVWGNNADKIDGSVYTYWKSKKIVPMILGEKQKAHFYNLCCERTGKLITDRDGKAGSSWLRSCDPRLDRAPIRFTSTGYVCEQMIFSDGNDYHAVTPCFAI